MDCICTRSCDCQAPDDEPALISNECPEHNFHPEPSPECRADVHWWDVAE